VLKGNKLETYIGDSSRADIADVELVREQLLSNLGILCHFKNGVDVVPVFQIVVANLDLESISLLLKVFEIFWK
jgi:hypothetical protein